MAEEGQKNYAEKIRSLWRICAKTTFDCIMNVVSHKLLEAHEQDKAGKLRWFVLVDG